MEMAVGEGFEPSRAFGALRDFESRAFDHSAIPPSALYTIHTRKSVVIYAVHRGERRGAPPARRFFF